MYFYRSNVSNMYMPNLFKASLPQYVTFLLILQISLYTEA